MTTLTIPVGGYGYGQASPCIESAEGPGVLKESSYLSALPFTLSWEKLIYNRTTMTGEDALHIVGGLSQQLGLFTQECVNEKKPFVVFGGDHTSAIGTWSGAATALSKKGPLGLIWVDAHMDSHTKHSSYSKNPHGMPVAALLGHGSSYLTTVLSSKPKVKPEHLCLVGVHSFESAEKSLLDSLGVRVFYMDEVNKLGIQATMREAIKHVEQGTAGYGLSIDLDAVDPRDAPAVCTAAPGGISGELLCDSVKHFADSPQFVGVEISEFNPKKDLSKKTEKLIANLLRSIFSPEEAEEK